MNADVSYRLDDDGVEYLNVTVTDEPCFGGTCPVRDALGGLWRA